MHLCVSKEKLDASFLFPVQRKLILYIEYYMVRKFPPVSRQSSATWKTGNEPHTRTKLSNDGRMVHFRFYRIQRHDFPTWKTYAYKPFIYLSLYFAPIHTLLDTWYGPPTRRIYLNQENSRLKYEKKYKISKNLNVFSTFMYRSQDYRSRYLKWCLVVNTDQLSCVNKNNSKIDSGHDRISIRWSVLIVMVY